MGSDLATPKGGVCFPEAILLLTSPSVSDRCPVASSFFRVSADAQILSLYLTPTHLSLSDCNGPSPSCSKAAYFMVAIVLFVHSKWFNLSFISGPNILPVSMCSLAN